jgi:hypothetical protein
VALSEAVQEWKELFMKTKEERNLFLDTQTDPYESRVKGAQKVVSYSKEPIEDVSENSSLNLYLAPRLAKEAFMERGKLYRTEKIIIRTHHSPFQLGSVE